MTPVPEPGLDAGFHIVSGEQSRDAIHDALPPAVVVLFENVQHGALLKTQLIVLVRIVVVNGDHCNAMCVLMWEQKLNQFLRSYPFRCSSSAPILADSGRRARWRPLGPGTCAACQSAGYHPRPVAAAVAMGATANRVGRQTNRSFCNGYREYRIVSLLLELYDTRETNLVIDRPRVCIPM